MPTNVLTPDRFEPLLDRFSRFGDAVIRTIRIVWTEPDPYCELAIDALDSTAPRSSPWVRVILRMDGLRGFYWYQRWSGSFECGELELYDFGESCVAAVGGGARFPASTTPDVFYDAADISMFVHGTQLSYEVITGDNSQGVTE